MPISDNVPAILLEFENFYYYRGNLRMYNIYRISFNKFYTKIGEYDCEIYVHILG